SLGADRLGASQNSDDRALGRAANIATYLRRSMDHAAGDVRDRLCSCHTHLARVLEDSLEGPSDGVDHRLCDVTCALDGRDDSILYGRNNWMALAHDPSPLEW